ncbi:MAG: GGDEF domain-containing protein [Betaproteobacteria bacterium HGW-Betaproteobacteria-22]|nr:MAG: GGDEF domain-containing protein [Betaproteobacteria bacterium HGW-Betaproteobacteria-22]
MVRQAAVQAAQLERLLATNTRTLTTSTLIAVVLAYVQSGVIALHVVIGWLSVLILFNVLRMLLGVYQQRHPVTDEALVRRRLVVFRVGVALSGLLWGATSYLLFPAENPQHQMFVIFVLTGMTAGGIVSYAVDLTSAFLYSILTLLPVLLCLFLIGDTISYTMSVAGFLYLVFLVMSVRYMHKSLIENIMLHFDALESEKSIKQLAFYDVLTNLPNRRLLLDRLNHALALSARSGKRGALLFLDLDHFKMLNDTLGHDKGDLLLKQVAERLLGCVRETDTVSRLGGDEFVVMLEDLSEDAAEANVQVDAVSQQIIASLNQPYLLGEFEYISTPSIGVAMFVEHGQSHEELLKNADIAMYQAKKAGRNAVRFFS